MVKSLDDGVECINLSRGGRSSKSFINEGLWKKCLEAKPDYVLILPWNLKHEIIAQMRHIGEWGGKFIVPIPKVEIIDPRA